MNENERPALIDDLSDLAGFMVVSARGLLDEPAHYGPFRLVDATSRLVTALERNGMATGELTALRDRIEAGKQTGMGSTEEFRAFLDELVLSLVADD